MPRWSALVSAPLLPSQGLLVRFLRNLCHALSFGFRGGNAVVMIISTVLTHLALVLMKIEIVYPGCSDLEDFNVARLIFHYLTLKTSDSYSQCSSQPA